ncbi:conserved hypothetical protein, membrane, partial [mine drainage metagenome]
MVVSLGMMLISCALPSSGFYRYFMPLIADSIYYAGQFSAYHPLINAMPGRLVPSKDYHGWLLRDFYLGFPPGGGAHHSYLQVFEAWARPLAFWSLFIIPMFGAIIFFSVLSRKQWVQRERLAFPLAIIPLEMMADPQPGHRLNDLWRNKVLWIGAAFSLGIDMYNGSIL